MDRGKIQQLPLFGGGYQRNIIYVAQLILRYKDLQPSYTPLPTICSTRTTPLPPLPCRPPSHFLFILLPLDRNICRGLFERHKLLFSALICFQILRHRGEIPREEWALFLRGAGLVDRAGQPANPSPSRFTPTQWDLIYAAEKCNVAATVKSGNSPATDGGDGLGDDEQEEETSSPPPFEGLCESIASEWQEWVSWADGGDVWDAQRIPGSFFLEGGRREGRQGGATAFQRLLLVKAFREDQLLRCIAQYVGEKLGGSFAERSGGALKTLMIIEPLPTCGDNEMKTR